MKKKLRYLLYSLLFFLPTTLFAQIANHLVISQIYGGGGNSGAIYTNDFVELYNPTSSNVDMTGWSLQYQSATGVAAFSGLMPFPDGATVKAHSYFLVQLASGGGVGVALPVTPDYIPLATNTTISFNMAAGSGKVALCNSTTNLVGTPVTTAAAPPAVLVTTTIVDFVSYGLANYNAQFVIFNPNTPAAANTAMAAPTISATSSCIRVASTTSTSASMAPGGADAALGNGYDSNVESVDFVIETGAANLVPRNSTTVAPVLAATPTLTATPTSLDFGTTQTVGTTSAPKSFSLSGTNIPAAGVSLSVAAPYAISATSGGTYGTSLTFTQAQMAAAQTVFVVFTPTGTTAAPGSVGITSGTASSSVGLTGTGVAAIVPGLTANPTTLAFGNINTTTAPVVKTFALSGVNLTTTTTVTATAPYTVSKDGTTYAASVTYTAAELLAATAPTVSVKFSPVTAGAANSTIAVTNASVASGATVTLTGTGVTPTLTANPTILAFGTATINTTSGAQTFSLSAANLTAGATLTTTAPYTLSIDGGNTYVASATITAATLATAQTVYVKFSPTALGPLPGTLSVASTGATSVTVSLTGTSVSAPVPALTLTPTTLTFSQLLGGTTAAASYTISGVNLTGATTVTVAAPYSISATATGTYGTTLTYTVAQLATAQTVYVKFTPTAVGLAAGSAINATAGGSSQTVTLNGTGIGIPALAATPTSLTFSQIIGTTSAAQSFSLAGAYLTATATTVTVAAPYQVSKDGLTNWGTAVTYGNTDFPPTGTATLNVYVRFSPTAIAVGGVNNGTATIASTGATSQTVTLNGSGLGVPVLTAAPTALTFLQAAGSTSSSQTVTLTAAYLTAATTVTTAAPYTISKDGITFSTSLSYAITELATPQTLYVKFAPTAIGTAAGSITLTNSGTATQTVTLNGTGGNSAPTLNALSDINICSTTTPQIVALAGITTGIETTQTYVVSVSTTNAALFSQIGVLPLTATTSQLNYTLAAGASGTAAVTVKVQDNGGTANGGVDTYTRTFNINVNALPTASVTSDIGTTISKGATAVLTAAAGGTAYSWSGSTGIVSGQNTAVLSVQPLVTTTYTVTVSNAGGCTATQAITITVNTFSPLVTNNILTPNGDGKNDTWIVQNITAYPTSSVKVVDKAGKTVFSKFNYQNDWDGTFNGQPLTQGTYYYVIDLGAGAAKYTGYITLIRN